MLQKQDGAAQHRNTAAKIAARITWANMPINCQKIKRHARHAINKRQLFAMATAAASSDWFAKYAAHPFIPAET